MCTARLCGNKVLARRLATKRKQQLRRDETAWYSRIADEAEDANRTGNSAVLYRTIRTLTGRTASKLPPVTAQDGSPLCHSVMKRTNTTDGKTKKSSTTLLHHSIQSSWPRLPVLLQTPQSILPHQRQARYRLQVRKLKKNRAPGICGITAELLKSGGAPVISWLLPLFTLIWKYCVIPTDWNLAIILPLWKGKGSKSNCTKYRGITSVCSGQGFRPHMSRTYEENNLCEAAAATERLYPWPIHT